jgi:hypothetical protein
VPRAWRSSRCARSSAPSSPARGSTLASGPPPSACARWERVALAHRRGLSLPPIAVKQGPDGYYVVDGRHRVSVALATGRREIDAWVA